MDTRAEGCGPWVQALTSVTRKRRCQKKARIKRGCLTIVLFSCSVVSDSAAPWTATCQASLSPTISQSLLKLMSTQSVMPSSHLILCRPLLSPSVFPSIRVFSSELTLGINMCVSLSGWSFIKPLVSYHTINYRASVEHDNGGAHTLMNDEQKLTLDSDEVSWAHVGGRQTTGGPPAE